MYYGERNYYDVLEARRNCSIDEVRAAFRRMSLRYHPDRDSSPGATERYREILQAYTVLSHPESKARYDRATAERVGVGYDGGYAREPRQPPPSGGYRRSEETESGDGDGARKPRWRGCLGQIGIVLAIYFGISLAIAEGPAIWDTVWTRLFEDASSTVATRTSTEVPESRGFGPVSGELVHNDDDFFEAFDSGLNVVNTVIEATFGDSYTSPGKPWNYGFVFRAAERRFHVVTVTSRRYWYHDIRDGEAPNGTKEVQRGLSSNIRPGTNVENHVRVIALDEIGWLFINGKFEAELDLSGITDTGSVGAITGWLEGHEHPGETTTYRDFSVRPVELKQGSVDGALRYGAGVGSYGFHSSSVWIADGIMESRFIVPEDDWISGFYFRDGGEGRSYGVVINGSANWLHWKSDSGHTEKLAFETGKSVATNRGDSNHLLVIALGETGHLFINNSYIADLDLSDWTGPGRVHAVAGSATANPIEGQSTQFERFAVWGIAELP